MGIQITTLKEIGNDCIRECIHNWYDIAATMALIVVHGRGPLRKVVDLRHFSGEGF